MILQDKMKVFLCLLSLALFFIVQRSYGQTVITNCDQLSWTLSNTSSFQLAGDIDCKGYGVFGSYLSDPFNTTLDGRGFSILNFAYNGNDSIVGLFAHCNKGTVKNLNLKNFTANSTGSAIAGLFGRSTHCTFNNVGIFNSSIFG